MHVALVPYILHWFLLFTPDSPLPSYPPDTPRTLRTPRTPNSYHVARECATSRHDIDPEYIKKAGDPAWALAFARIEWCLPYYYTVTNPPL